MNRLVIVLIYLCLSFSCGSIEAKKSMPQYPEAVDTFQFYGDSREGPEIYSTLLQLGFAHYPLGPVIHLGDIISSPRHPEEYGPFLALSTLYVKKENFHIVVGNHDVDNAASFLNLSRIFPEVGDQGYYSRMIGNCYCIFLNTEDLTVGGNGIGPEQLSWLTSELSSDRAKKAKYRFILMHRPLYPQNQHVDEPLKENDALHAIFKFYKVDAVIAGHEHSYSHQVKDGIHYLVTGGAGSPLFKGGGPSAFFHYVQMFEFENVLKFYAIDLLGRTKDEFTINLHTL